MSNPRSYAPSLPVRRLLAALALAALTAVVILGTPSQAQTAVTLVSNTGQSADIDSVFSFDLAQGFTTGGDSAGYKLTRVDIRLGAKSPSPNFSVHVYSSDSSGAPGSSLGMLTAPSDLITSSATSNTTYTFTHTGIDLAANTTYYVVIDATQDDGSTAVSNTLTANEDAGAAAGWSIADRARYRTWSSTGGWTAETSTLARMIAISGYARPPATPTGLTARAGQDGITLNWNNPGNSSITRYEYSLDGSTWVPIPNSGPGTTSHTIAGLTSGTVRLRAVNANGTGRHATSSPVVQGRIEIVAVYDTAGWARFRSRFGENCWDEHDAAVAAARTLSGRTPEEDELARCQRFLAEDIRDVEYVRRVVR